MDPGPLTFDHTLVEDTRHDVFECHLCGEIVDTDEDFFEVVVRNKDGREMDYRVYHKDCWTPDEIPTGEDSPAP